MLAQIEIQKKIRACQEKTPKCKKLVKANASLQDKVKKQVQKLVADLKAAKIDNTQFIAKLRELKDQGLKDKTNIDLIKCSIEHCNENLKEMMKNNLSMLEKVCKITNDKNACAKVKEIKQLSNNLTFENYMKIIEVLNKLSQA